MLVGFDKLIGLYRKVLRNTIPRERKSSIQKSLNLFPIKLLGEFASLSKGVSSNASRLCNPVEFLGSILPLVKGIDAPSNFPVGHDGRVGIPLYNLSGVLDQVCFCVKLCFIHLGDLDRVIHRDGYV